MNTLLRISGVLILSIGLVVSCSKSTKNQIENSKTEPPSVKFTPKENEEAELIALCLSGELVAPDSLYNQILDDLASIRATFGDTIEVLNQIKFRAPWQSGCLWIGFDTSAIQQIRNGQYHAWDSLNQQYQVTYIDTSFFDFIGFALLRFNGRLHPYRLDELYSVLPGVNVASPSGIFGDGPNIYTRHSEVDMTYLFRNAWNDCPAGCIDNEYWYFVLDEDKPFLIGYWPQYQQPQPPDWWEEAKLNKSQYCNP